jgi:5-methylcytosine-specific restriction protein A
VPGKWEGSDRRDRLPENWVSEIVPYVKRRARGRCEQRLPSGKRCPRPGTDVDHRKPGDDHSYGNLQLLCSDHHDVKSSREGNSARWGKKKISPRKEGQHPGRVR